MSKRAIRLTLLGVILISGFSLAALIFWTMDFHASQSQTHAQHTLSTSTVSSPDRRILMQEGIVIQTAETGLDLLDTNLTQELTDRFRLELPADKVTLGNESDGRPILWIEVRDTEIHWTPFRANADLTIEVIYASDGDISWRNATGTIMSGDQPAVHSRGNLQLLDNTQGIISRKAYQRHLSTQIAAEVYRMMHQPLFDPPG
ncbi:MAG: hypothetical protein KF893_07845 [Caldilineaceae bacterium]|nr:hypothetical protein [Caldilineaceae bacterium]